MVAFMFAKKVQEIIFDSLSANEYGGCIVIIITKK